MSLIKAITPPTVKENIINENTICLVVMKRSAKTVFDLLWRNTTKTPQEVCDMFGTDAVNAFIAHGALQELIYLLDPTWVPLVPLNEYTPNQDGTVTIVIPPPIGE